MKVKQYRKILLLVLMICAAILLAVWNGHSADSFPHSRSHQSGQQKTVMHRFPAFFQRCSSDEGLCDTAGTEIKNCIAGGIRGYIGCKWKNAGGLLQYKGELTLYSDRASITARAFGVGGDFLHFIR